MAEVGVWQTFAGGWSASASLQHGCFHWLQKAFRAEIDYLTKTKTTLTTGFSLFPVDMPLHYLSMVHHTSFFIASLFSFLFSWSTPPMWFSVLFSHPRGHDTDAFRNAFDLWGGFFDLEEGFRAPVHGFFAGSFLRRRSTSSFPPLLSPVFFARQGAWACYQMLYPCTRLFSWTPSEFCSLGSVLLFAIFLGPLMLLWQHGSVCAAMFCVCISPTYSCTVVGGGANLASSPSQRNASFFCFWNSFTFYTISARSVFVFNAPLPVCNAPCAMRTCELLVLICWEPQLCLQRIILYKHWGVVTLDLLLQKIWLILVQ